MSARSPRGTLLEIKLLEENYGRSFLTSVGIHAAAVAFFLVVPYLLPARSTITLGTGPGGGMGEGFYTVGVADDLGGGQGMTKPSLVPRPPALPVERPAKEAVKKEAVPLPHTVEAKKARSQEKSRATPKEATPSPKANVIPTRPEPGAGGTGGVAGGGGGGRGGGVGVSLGPGAGGIGDFWYARVVEARIGSNWIKPIVQGRIEIVYSFMITNEGMIRDIKKEKSSGNEALDLTAERAIRACSTASNPLPPLPPELRGRPVQFMAQFIYPPNP